MRFGVVMYQTSFTGGQELVAQRMTRELNNQGHQSYLISSPFHDGKLIPEYDRLRRSVEGYLLFGDSEFQVPIIRVDGYISTWPPRRIMLRDFVRVLRDLVERLRLDIIVSHSTLWNGPEEIAKFITWKRMMREQGLHEKEVLYIHMSHYQPPDPVRYNLIERTFRAAWNNLVFPQIFKTAQLLLCVTPYEVKQMVALGAEKKRCHLYPGGIDKKAFKIHESKDTSNFLKKYFIPRDSRIITYLGTIEERKNPLAVVKVARKLRRMENIHFVIAGHPSNQDAIIRREAKILENVSYLGTITEEAKIALIRSSYINILLSRMEALGLTQLEFMYGGVPVITSAVGGQKWVVRDGVDGFHLNGPDDIDGAMEMVKKLVSNPDLRDRLGENAKKRAKKYTLSKLTSNLVSRLTSEVQPS